MHKLLSYIVQIKQATRGSLLSSKEILADFKRRRVSSGHEKFNASNFSYTASTKLNKFIIKSFTKKWNHCGLDKSKVCSSN